SVTSAEIAATPSRAWTEASASAPRATTVTLAPCPTRASTSPRPRPRLPPVTTTFLFLRLMVLLPRPEVLLQRLRHGNLFRGDDGLRFHERRILPLERLDRTAAPV